MNQFIPTPYQASVSPLGTLLRAKIDEEALKGKAPPTTMHAAPLPIIDTIELDKYFNSINSTLPPDGVSDVQEPANSTGGKKYDAGKADYTLLPFNSLNDTVKVLGFGAIKYGRGNWQGVERQRYVAAAFRHLVAIAQGEQFDVESGLPHSAHLTCCSLFIGELDHAQNAY
jgi:Domain of unknown function (DUF5664)